MSATGPLFAFPTDLVGAGATITSTGATVDTEYPLTGLHDGDPMSLPARWTGTAETRIIYDFGALQKLEGMMIALHTVAAGATVKVEANGSNTWGAPSFSKSITVLASDDRHSVNITADLRGTSLASTGFQWVSVLLPAGSINHGIGELLWIPQWQQLSRPPVKELPMQDVRRPTIHTTSYGKTHRLDRLVRQRRMLINILPSVADMLLIRKLARKADGSRLGFPFVLRPLKIQTDPQYFVTLGPDSELTEMTDPDFDSIQLDLLEVANGLPLV